MATTAEDQDEAYFVWCAHELRLDESRGVDSPRGLQARIVANMRARRDCMATVPCGCGKTLAFMLNALSTRDHLVLVITPLRGLCQQIADDGDAIVSGSAGTSVTTDTDFDDDNNEAPREADAFGPIVVEDVSPTIPDDSPQGTLLRHAGTDLFVFAITPDAINPAVTTESSTRWIHGFAILRQRGVLALIVIDEVNTYLPSIWGEFRESMKTLPQALRLITSGSSSDALPTTPPPSLLGITGTASTDDIATLMQHFNFPKHTEVLRAPLDRQNMTIQFHDFCGLGGEPIEILKHMASTMLPLILNSRRSLLFVQKQAEARSIASFLFEEYGITCFPYYGGLNSAARTATLKAFKVCTKRAVLVSTELYGRGHHCPDISLVVHLCIRWKFEQLWQEMCRGGRDGSNFLAVQAFHPSLVASLKSRDYDSAPSMMSYLTGRSSCRRSFLLRSLGDSVHGSNACPSCPACQRELWHAASSNFGTTYRDLYKPALGLLRYCNCGLHSERWSLGRAAHRRGRSR